MPQPGTPWSRHRAPDRPLHEEEATVLNPTDSRNFHRTFQALALIVGPLLLLAAVLIDAAVFTGDNAAERLPQIRDNGGVYLATSWMFLLAGLILVPGI